MIGVAAGVTVIVCAVMLWPRRDGGGVPYSLALICGPCTWGAISVLAMMWIWIWYLGG